MSTYLEIKVPIQNNANWFKNLIMILDPFNVKWQKGYYHITMAFIDESPRDIDWEQILDRHFKQIEAFEITFDKIDVFSTRSGIKIINLTATHVPESFTSLVDAVRKDLVSAGCRIQSSFKLHVTLGRARFPDSQLGHVRELISKISIPNFALTLSEVDLKYYDNHQDIYVTSLKKY